MFALPFIVVTQASENNMPPAASAYHIRLNGGGFILVDGSYIRRSQQAFNPRFSTGDPNYGDLSFWQFQGEEDFSGGMGQLLSSDKTMFKQASGWDTRFNKPRLACGYADLTKVANFPAPSSFAPTTFYDDFESGTLSKWINTAGGYSVQSILGSLRAVDMSGTGIGSDIRAVSTQSYGTWQFDITLHGNGAGLDVMIIVLNFTDGGNWYQLRVSGAGMVTWKLEKWYGGALTVLKTFTAISKVDIATTMKLTRDSSGVFNLYQDTVLLDTVTDTQITANGAYFLVELYGGAGGIYTTIDNVLIFNSVSASTTANVGATGKAVPYNGAIFVCYKTAAVTFTITKIRDESLTNNTPAVYHVNCSDLAAISRDGDIGGINYFLLAVNDATLKVINTALAVAATITLTGFGTCIIPISSTRVIVAGTTGEHSGDVTIDRITFTAGAHAATQVAIREDLETQGIVAPYYAIDSSGTIYFTTLDMQNTPGTCPSRIFRLTSTDAIAANMTVSDIEQIQNFKCRGLFSISGTVYYFGALLDGNYAYDCIMSYPGTIVYKSTKAIEIHPETDKINFNYGIQSVFPVSTGVLFLTNNDLDKMDTLVELQNSGALHPCAAFISKQFGSAQPNPLTIFEWGGSYYFVRPLDDILYKTSTSRGNFTNTPNLYFELSEIGANTPLIKKAAYSVLIEVSEAVPVSWPLIVEINGVTIGTFTSIDGTSKELLITEEIAALSFKVILSTNGASTWKGRLERCYVRYVPVQYKKRAWGFSIRADMNQQLLSGQRDRRTADKIIADVEQAWAENKAIQFQDTDGKTFNVLVTDFSERQPLISTNPKRREKIITIELLEA